MKSQTKSSYRFCNSGVSPHLTIYVNARRHFDISGKLLYTLNTLQSDYIAKPQMDTKAHSLNELM